MYALAVDLGRFAVAGAVNTLISFVIYQAALCLLPPSASYAIAWGAGLAFVVLVYPDHVFRGGRRAPADRALLAASYAVLFLIGLLTLDLMVKLTAAPRLAIIATLFMTTTASFLVSWYVLRRTRRKSPRGRPWPAAM
jgi:putative flippase GtrA